MLGKRYKTTLTCKMKTPGIEDPNTPEMGKLSSLSIHMDELIGKLGNPGKFQMIMFILLCLNYCPLVFNHVIMAFFGAQLTHTCNAVGNVSFYDHGGENLTIIGRENGKCDTKLYLEGGTNLTVKCQHGQWEYATEERETTIGTEWDLVCDDASLAGDATTIYFGGVMLGGLIFGFLSDKFGRRPIVLVTLYAPVAIGVGIFFVPSYTWFVVLRFVEGFFLQGLQISTYVLVAEMFTYSFRPIAGALVECFWGLSVLIIAGIAFLIRDWRYIQLAIALPSLLTIFYICVIPESFRWMIMHGKFEKGTRYIEKVVRFNGVEFPRETWSSVQTLIKAGGKLSSSQYTFLDLLKSPQMRKRSLILFYLWFAASVGYYGLIFKTTSLAGNKYLNFFIGACVEMVACVMDIYIMKKYKRRYAVIAYSVLSAVTCIVAGALPPQTLDSGLDLELLSTGFALVGRFAVTGTFSLLFLYTTELYPTVIRNIGMGTCAFWTRLGGVVAPQINRLDDASFASIPIIVFGVMMLLVAILTFFLAETHEKKLPNTIDDVEDSEVATQVEPTYTTKL